MPNESIQPFDFQRIFIGDLPWSFTLEVVFRTVIIYLFALLLIRWLSRRAVGQLSLVEFLLVVALGSAVGDPMFYPDVPLLHAMVVMTVVVLLNRGLDRLIERSERVERIIEGAPVRLVHEGLIDHKNLQHLAINRDELFQYLRLQGIENLGTVRAAYMEQSGRLSIFQFAAGQAKAGLVIMPPWELDSPPWLGQGMTVEGSQMLGCVRCGYTSEFAAKMALPTCCALWLCNVDGPHSHGADKGGMKGDNMARWIIVLGAVLIVVGIILQFAPWLLTWFGRLPGDIRMSRRRRHISYSHYFNDSD
ncbi:MAG: DUF421 domain-containing protein [Caldilineaceae bacterium]